MIKPKKSVENMTGYFVPMYEKDWDIKIDSNENNYGPSPKVIEGIKNINYKNISFYPFYGELSQKIADYQGVSIDNVKVTNGADEAISGIIQTYLEEGEALLTLDVSFEMPVIYTLIQAGNIIKVPFKEKWEFPYDDFMSKLDDSKVKIVYIASPNNPTGSIVDKKFVNDIAEKYPEKVIIIDETYAGYCGISNKDLVKQYDNIFIVKSFSKDFALAGLRLGYIVSSKENIQNLKKVISPYSVNAIAMKAGILALSDIDYFINIRNEIEDSKKELKDFFENLNAKVYDSYANFLLIDFGQKAQYVYKKLEKKNISVKIYKKGHLLENHIRMTIPTKNAVEKIKKALQIKPNLVFDMDGVLVNATKSYRIAIEKTYEKYTGKKINPIEIQNVKNMGGMNNDWDLTKYLIEQEGISISYEQMVETFQEFYWNDGNGLINNEEPLFNREFFEKLTEKYNLSIFTGRLKQEAMYAIKRFNAEDLFYPIITTDDIPQGREKPDPYGLNLTKMITIGKDYYYFGDTVDDMKAASEAGYYPVGVLPPQDKSDDLKQKLKQFGAKKVINSVNELEIENETVLQS